MKKLYIPFRYIGGDISKSIKISRENSILIGKDIRIIRGDTEKVGKALDIDEEGQLVVEMENGNIEKVYSGEVSVRGMKGYVDQ